MIQRSRVAVAAVGVGVALALGGCATPGVNACPAIGWPASVHVTVTGDAAAVSSLRFCDDDGVCREWAGEESTPSGPLPSDYVISRGTEGSWTVAVLGADPDSATVTLLDASGGTLAETTSELDWRRTGGTAECGGPMEAGPIEMALPKR
jgi:hypothetical protein